MPADPSVPAGDDQHDRDAAYCATLDAVSDVLREQARAWARQLRLVGQLDTLARGARTGTAQFVQLEMAGSWQIGQLTATRWQWESERMHDALPRTLAMLERGDLLVHQATVLLHRTRSCTPEVARAVEASVLPAGADLVPSDLSRLVDRTVLQVESEQADAAAAEQRHAEAAAQRHTFAKPLQDGMGLAGAVLTAEQLVAWRQGLDVLERRERLADRAHGVERTAEQRRADLFAALPAMVLAGTAQDRVGFASGSGVDLGHGCGPRPGACPASAASHSDSDSDSHPDSHRPGAADLRPWTLGPEQVAAQVVLNVLVPVSTVLDLSRAPGTLDGYGPISAEHVRLLRPHSWRRVLVDATSGRPIALDDQPTPIRDDPHDPVGRHPHDPPDFREQVRARLTPEVVTDVDEPQHDPSARLARLVDLRDVRCCGPGCSSTRTHRDHLEPYPAGPTSAANLGRLSPRCHRAKHGGWLLVRHPDGSTTWTSPVGRTYDRPSPHAPPPHVDLDAASPPPRPRPRASGDGLHPVWEPALPEDPDPLHDDRPDDEDEHEEATRTSRRPTRAARPPEPSADVAQVVDDVVQVVPAEARDGEPAAVAAHPRPVPGRAGDAVVRRGRRLRRRQQLVRDDGGVLLAVPLLDGGRVLVPVREGRRVLLEHEQHPAAHRAVDVADVAAVLQRRPHPLGRSPTHLGPPQHRRPLRCAAAQIAGKRARLDVGGVEAAVGARALEHPRPVLGVRYDVHGRSLPGPDLTRTRVRTGAMLLAWPVAWVGARGRRSQTAPPRPPAADRRSRPAHEGARERPVVLRHCWVSGLGSAPGRHPGLLAEWRHDPATGRWLGRVVYAVDEQGRAVLVERWVPAEHLTPA